MKKKYFVRVYGTKVWNEVTREEYIKAEQGAGFRSKFGPDRTATAYFSDGSVEGKIEYPTKS